MFSIDEFRRQLLSAGRAVRLRGLAQSLDPSRVVDFYAETEASHEHEISHLDADLSSADLPDNVIPFPSPRERKLRGG